MQTTNVTHCHSSVNSPRIHDEARRVLTKTRQAATDFNRGTIKKALHMSFEKGTEFIYHFHHKRYCDQIQRGEVVAAKAAVDKHVERRERRLAKNLIKHDKIVKNEPVRTGEKKPLDRDEHWIVVVLVTLAVLVFGAGLTLGGRMLVKGDFATSLGQGMLMMLPLLAGCLSLEAGQLWNMGERAFNRYLKVIIATTAALWLSFAVLAPFNFAEFLVALDIEQTIADATKLETPTESAEATEDEADSDGFAMPSPSRFTLFLFMANGLLAEGFTVALLLFGAKRIRARRYEVTFVPTAKLVANEDERAAIEAEIEDGTMVSANLEGLLNAIDGDADDVAADAVGEYTELYEQWQADRDAAERRRPKVSRRPAAPLYEPEHRNGRLNGSLTGLLIGAVLGVASMVPASPASADDLVFLIPTPSTMSQDHRQVVYATIVEGMLRADPHDRVVAYDAMRSQRLVEAQVPEGEMRARLRSMSGAIASLKKAFSVPKAENPVATVDLPRAAREILRLEAEGEGRTQVVVFADLFDLVGGNAALKITPGEIWADAFINADLERTPWGTADRAGELADVFVHVCYLVEGTEEPEREAVGVFLTKWLGAMDATLVSVGPSGSALRCSERRWRARPSPSRTSRWIPTTPGCSSAGSAARTAKRGPAMTRRWRRPAPPSIVRSRP